MIKGIEQYYSKKLGVEKVFILPETATGDSYLVNTTYATFFAENDVTTINENVVEQFIENNEINRIYIEASEKTDIESLAKKVIDKLSTLDRFIPITIVSSLNSITTYREQPNYYFFDYYYIKEVKNIEHTYTRIYDEMGENRIGHNNYYYSKIN